MKAQKSLFMSVVSLLLCVSMLVGSTFAWFTDSVSSGSNVITSGNLDLEVQYTLDGENWKDLNGAKDLFQKGLWEPGHTEVVALKVSNVGSLALKYVASMKIFQETVGKTKDGKDIVLSDILTVSTLTQQANAFGDIALMLAYMGENKVGYETTSSFKAANVLGQEKELLPGDAHYVFIKVDMAETVGNEANHDGVHIPTIDFGINVLASQFAYENDSFGNQYDAGATFDDLANTSILATETKTLEEGASSVGFNLVHNGMTIANVTVPASAIADTTKPVTVTFDGINPSQAAIVDENTQAYAYDIDVTNLKDNLSGDQLITVVVTAPNALAAMKAYHNGVLIQDAVYDEVEGTITFKTANFSPFAFTANVTPVYNLEELRTVLNTNEANAKLMADLEIDLREGKDRSEAHKALSTNGKNTWYNGVNIKGLGVGLDLNGHKITVKCYDADNYNGHSNQDVGALFFVDKEGSLNINDTVGGGFIKMASSIYAVWAPYDDPSYMDIYGGVFIADSYAGDPIGTPPPADDNPMDDEMKYENSNRALIYAGTGGKMNIYGGYFLYNSTPNDFLNRNNGAFNCTNWYEGDDPYITIHDGVMLIDKGYKQDPTYTSTPNGSFDEHSIKLAKHCEVVQTTDFTAVAGITPPNGWYRVTERKPVSLTVTGYKDVFSNGDSFEQGEEFAATVLLSDGTTRDVTDDVTFSGYDPYTVGANVITVTYTSEDVSVSTTYIVRFIVPVNLTVEPKKSLYNVGEVKAKDFKVTVYDSTGVATTLSNFNISVNGNINVAGHVNVTITSGDLSATCTILMWNMNKLEGNNMHTMHYSVPVLFNVSGWSNHTLGNTYVNLAGTTQTIPGTGEVVSGMSYANNLKWNSSSPTGYVYTRGTDGNLTVKNASRYTTLGIEYWLGYDTAVSAVGYYFDGDMSTLQFAGPACDISPENVYYQFLGTNAFRTNYLTCDLYDFKPGSTHTVHWVAIFGDGIQTFAEWTVTMKEETANDGAYEVDPNKPNVNVIILAGQSNAAGSAPITDDIRAQYGDKQFSNVFINYINQEAVGNTVTTYFTNGDNFDMYKLGIGGFGANYFGPELGLADYLSTNASDEAWYIIKYAPSGSELDRQWFGEAKLADRMIGYVKDKINILAQDYNVKVAGFVWMQGESDALDLAPGVSNRYSSNEQKLMKMVRDEFAAYATRNSTALGTPGSGIVFVNGGIAASGVWPQHATINNAKKANCAWWYDPVAEGFTNPGGNIVNSVFVDTSTLISKNQSYVAGLDDYGNTHDNSDQAHYSDESMVKLGTWFGTALWSMITNCP